MRVIYDIHMHAFDLSHPNLSAFISRLYDHDPRVKRSFWDSIKGLFSFLKNIKDKLALMRNALVMLEYPIEDYFLILEYFLKQEPAIIVKDKINIFKEEPYDRLVICPLMIDFGQRNALNNPGFYKVMPGKPIAKQTKDLFNAIKNYYSFEFTSIDSIEKVTYNGTPKPLLILPFLGIKPFFYQRDEKQLEDLFKKYFSGYENDNKEMRKTRAFDLSQKAFMNFSGNLENGDFTNMFFGVKVYPPLGYEPISTVNHKLYELCIKYKLPITTHCSDGGFVTESTSVQWTDPRIDWKQVLVKYPELKLNFAHFGSQRKSNSSEWKKQIIFNFSDEKLNVYADLSCCLFDLKDYNELIDWLDKNDPKGSSNSKLLFGSDFFLNLFWSKSYNDYLLCLDNQYVIKGRLDKIFERNPEEFLFKV